VAQRLRRYYGGQHLHFITASCYRRQALLATKARRDLFLRILEEVRRRYRFVVVGYVVMPEHIHLLISEPEQGDPSKVMQVLKQRVARRLLRRNRTRVGQGMLFRDAIPAEHFWQRRFYDFNVFSQRKLAEKLRYMHRNPVRRGLVGAPELWAWSSFRAYASGEAGVVKVNDWPTMVKPVSAGSTATHPSKTAKGGAPRFW
jgi:putative transposase